MMRGAQPVSNMWAKMCTPTAARGMIRFVYGPFQVGTLNLTWVLIYTYHNVRPSLPR